MLGYSNEPFMTISGGLTHNLLILSNVEFSIGSSASYDSFEFMGRPESHYAYKNGKTNNISLSFELYATDQEHKSSTSGFNTWRAKFVNGTNQMGVRDVEVCSNWLMSTTKPKKEFWLPPERLTISVYHFIKNMDVVAESCEKSIIDAAGYQVNTELMSGFVQNNGPRGVKISMSLIPVFDLHKVPFRDDIMRGRYNV